MRLARRLREFETGKSRKGPGGRYVTLFVDLNFEEELLAFLEAKKNVKIKKKFQLIADMLVSGMSVTKELYRHEKVSEQARDVYVFRIKIEGNHRIYTKEFYEGYSRKIVLIAYENKKTEGLSKKIKDLIERIGEYDYEFQE